MRTKKNELEVDFIGGEGPLTKEQEKTISDFIKKQKAKINLSSPKTRAGLATKPTRSKERA